MPWPKAESSTAALHPDGRIAALTTGDGVVLFDLRRSELLVHIDVESPYYLDFTTDGRQLLCGSMGGLQSLAVEVAPDREVRVGSPEWLLRTDNPGDRVEGCLSADGSRYFAQHGSGIEELVLSDGQRRRFEGTIPFAIH